MRSGELRQPAKIGTQNDASSLRSDPSSLTGRHRHPILAPTSASENRRGKAVREMTPREILDAIDTALEDTGKQFTKGER
jgi:hypothetical protein